MPSTEPETYDVWVINDADGPVLYFPVASDSPVPPHDHVALHRQQAVRSPAPDGLIEGVWARARQRLAGPADRLVAEIADPEVATRRAAQRAATMARGADAAAWAPEELLAGPEPDPAPPTAPPRGTRRREVATPTSSAPRRRAPASARAKPKPKPAPPPAEPAEAVCPRCFMLRRVDQLDADGVCTFCQ